jgi:hypothetical protein
VLSSPIPINWQYGAGEDLENADETNGRKPEEEETGAQPKPPAL